MERASLFIEFKQILAEHVSAKQTKALDNLHEQTNLIDELGIESLDIVNIVIDMEDRFNIEVDNDSIKKMSTVGNCIDLIQEKCCALCAVSCRA
jgi:acyl carrier protein